MNQNQLIPSEGRNGFYPRENGAAGDVAGAGRPAHNGETGPVQKVERSINYMVEHVNQPLQVPTLAALANVSPSHFFALFKRLTGLPPIEYFTRLRMRHACQIFNSTSASVKEVAARLGYDDPFYFSRVFKSVNKIPPSEYRTQLKQWRAELREAALPRPVSGYSDPSSFNRVELSAQGTSPDRLQGAGITGKETVSVKKVLLSIP